MEAAGRLVVAIPILGLISNPPGDAGFFLVGCGCHPALVAVMISYLGLSMKKRLTKNV